MRLADFITANVEPILMEWEAFARGIWPGPATDPATLRDHAEQMLHAAVADMRSVQSDQEQSDKSKGNAGDGPDAARVDRVSAEHGVGRVGSGFDLATVIAEYRALRASVIRLWRETGPATDLNDLYDITRFNESIDQSLTQAVVAYSRHVEQERTAAFEQQARHGDELRKLNNELLVSSVRQHELTEQAEQATAAMRDAKEEAEAANWAKDEFLAVVSHELRTPLSAILIYGKLLREGRMEGQARSEAADAIVQSAEAQRRLIEDLLDVSRVVAGNLRLDVREADLAAAVQAAVEVVLPMAEAKGIELQVSLDARVRRVRLDPDRIQQVVWNLLSNSVKFSSRGGLVRVALKRLDGAVEIRVSDAGRGIKAEFLPHVFEMFRQEDASSTRAVGGLGLGLAICRQLVELHGGTIRVESAGGGKGATFTVTLPIAAGVPSRPEKARGEALDAGGDKSAPSGDLAGIRVLVVEDDAAVRWLLEQSAADVTAVGSADEALAALAESLTTGRRFDVLASDIGLPGKDGYEFVRAVRRIEHDRGETRGIPALAISAYGRDVDRAEARVAGFDAHIAKPVEPATLVGAVAKLAGRAGGAS